MSAQATTFKRYAVYFTATGSALSEFGSKWLGWDIHRGCTVPHPDMPGLPLPVTEVTGTPRRYGFHATIVPPFYLLGDLAQLRATLHSFCANSEPVDLESLELTQLGRFLALVPTRHSDQLQQLAAGVVEACNTFRTPLEPADFARHLARGLSTAQEALLARWGYPYVMQEFRFHMTLSGKLPKAQTKAVYSVLTPYLAPILSRKCTISDLSLVGEDDAGFFHVIETYSLT